LNQESAALLASAKAALDDGELDSAREVLRLLCGRAGHTPRQWLTIGELCRRAGDMPGAESALSRAVALAPADPGARVALAALLRNAGRPAEALDHLETACRVAPDDARAAHLMGLMHLDQGLVAGARDWLARSRDAGGNGADLHADLGLAAQAAGDLGEAEACYRQALSEAPTHEGALRGMARLARLRRRPEDGLAVLEPLAADLRSGGLLSELAGLMASSGRSEEAIALLEARLPELESREARMEVDFRLGELYDSAGDREAAMTHLIQANRGKQASFDPAHYAGLVDRLLAAFGPRAMAELPKALHGDDRPVFIVGMPRSGTSLVEQILASHRDVHGAGELTDLGLLALSTGNGAREYPESVADLAVTDLDRLASAYRARLDDIAPGARRVTDKMWQNFEFLGFAALLFPDSRVIHCRRDPMDMGLSCFFQHFYGAGVAFAYDLTHIGAYYRQYRRVMSHWREALPLPILEVSYERLVADTDNETRRIVEFLGLPWDPSCLRFFETERVVGTASYEQVRRPVYGTSVGRHRDYRQWLDPLARALEDERPAGE
jgi:tetratricopeptide (TPR) repeat protein